MAKRGRPRYPDILTPREWEVLALLRQGLSNEEIGARLAITERTAKYHVSEILGKLGVSSREEAAAWQPEEARPWWAVAGAPLLFWRKLSFGWLPAAAAGGVVVVVAAGLGLLAWGLVRTQGDGGAADGAASALVAPTASPARAPAAMDVSARQPKQYVIVYVRPISQSPPAATLYIRTVDAQGRSSGDEIELEGMYRAELVPPNSPGFATTPTLVAYTVTGQRHVMYLGEGGPVPVEVLEGYSALRGAVWVGDIGYGQEGGTIVGRDAQGQVVASYQLPKPVPPRGDEPVFRTTAIIDPERASTSAIVPTFDGHLLAFIEGVTNSVLADLTTGERLNLLGHGRVLTSTLAEDGFVYAVVWGSDESELHVMKIDPLRLRIVAQQSTGFSPSPSSQRLLNGWAFLATPDGGVYAYLPSINLATGATDSLLYKVDRETAATTLVPLPPALGLDATVGVDGNIYFSGGPAENRVSIYDPVTGELQEDVPWLRAPEGTYIRGIVVR